MDIQLPGGIQFSGLSEKEAEIVRGRAEFVARYFAMKGWDVNDPTIEQVLETRQQPGWRNPGGTIVVEIHST